jgi:hypothetical protein
MSAGPLNSHDQHHARYNKFLLKILGLDEMRRIFYESRPTLKSGRRGLLCRPASALVMRFDASHPDQRCLYRLVQRRVRLVSHEDLRRSPRCKATFDALVLCLQGHIAAAVEP